jgi:hypothetical protein
MSLGRSSPMKLESTLPAPAAIARLTFSWSSPQRLIVAGQLVVGFQRDLRQAAQQ